MSIKRLLLIILSVIISINFTSCVNNKKDSNKVKIITTFYPIYIMALNITDGIDNVEVLNMSEQNTGCLHDFQLKTEDMKNIETADAVIINGAGMETFMDKIFEEFPQKNVIDSSKGIDLIKENYHDDIDSHNTSHDGHNHHHDDVNPHIWVSISNYIMQVENVSNGLVAIDPDNKDKYKKNTDKYIASLNNLKSEMHNNLSNVSKKDIITLHESFDYFAKEFNLNIIAVINHEPNTDPSSKEIKETIDIVNKFERTIPLFVEPQYPSTSAEVISNETGAKVYMLDSGVTGENVKDSYIKAMQKNLLVLKEALI